MVKKKKMTRNNRHYLQMIPLMIKFLKFYLVGSNMKSSVFSKLTFKRTHFIGTSLLLVSALITSANHVYYANRVQNVNPFVFTFISFLITALFFFILSSKKGENSTINKVVLSDLVMLNVSSALAFMGFYYALKFIEPAIVSALEMGIGPFFAIILGRFLYRKEEATNHWEWLIAVGTFVASLMLIWAVITGKTGVQNSSYHLILNGVIASLFCGIGAVLSTIYSKKLSNANWNSRSILAHRFYAMIFISLILSRNQFHADLINNWNWILIVTIFGVALPLYLLQRGIQYCEPFFVMMSICFVPVFTFFFQFFDPRIQWSTLSFVGILLLLFFGILSIFVCNKY
jgi:drug/metabolite transporter (DMT)-like permease